MLLFINKLLAIIRSASVGVLLWLPCRVGGKRVSRCCAVLWARVALLRGPGPCCCLSCLSKSWEDHFIIVCLPRLTLLSRREPLGKWGLAAVFAVCSVFFCFFYLVASWALSGFFSQSVKLLSKICRTAPQKKPPAPFDITLCDGSLRPRCFTDNQIYDRAALTGQNILLCVWFLFWMTEYKTVTLLFNLPRIFFYSCINEQMDQQPWICVSCSNNKTKHNLTPPLAPVASSSRHMKTWGTFRCRGANYRLCSWTWENVARPCGPIWNSLQD